MESFILSCANEADIDLSRYGLKSDLESLKAKTKSTTSMDDPQLKSLFHDLSPTFLLFSKILCTFANKYCQIVVDDASESLIPERRVVVRFLRNK